MNGFPLSQGLFDPAHDRDSCGITLVADLQGQPSHHVVTLGLEALARMEHRGARGADGKTGDGVGILTQIPDKFFRRIAAEQDISLPEPGAYGILVLFLPQCAETARLCRTNCDEIFTKFGFKSLFWRSVPVDSSYLGPLAQGTEPQIWQVIISKSSAASPNQEAAFLNEAAALFLIRRLIEKSLEPFPECSVISLDSRTLVYKGMMLAHDLPHYYPDLGDPDYVSALSIVHARFSTNTFPSWKLAQPFRRLCHNGEINTLKGNIAHIRSRTQEFTEHLFGSQAELAQPLIIKGLSDSAYLDLMLELLLLSGKSLPEALMILIPEAWQKNPDMDSRVRAFYEYHAPLMEPWDGPAAIIATDGQRAAIALDRNGLRPCRYTISKQGIFVAASEAGAIPVAEDDVVKHGRLGPGELIVVDPFLGGIVDNLSIKSLIAQQKPYEAWVSQCVKSRKTSSLISSSLSPDPLVHLLKHQLSVGMSQEELKMVIKPMAEHGEEPVSSMGDDTPLAVLSEEPRLLFDFFKQQFAQVTNPPIDPIRENLVMSLEVYLGRKGSVMLPAKETTLVALDQPIITPAFLEDLLSQESRHLKSCRLSLLIPKSDDSTFPLGSYLAHLGQKTVDRVLEGHSIIVLSDRGMDAQQLAIPSLLAVASIHNYLISRGLRSHVDIIIETAEARTVHHMACLLGFGAQAICPYLAFDSIHDLIKKRAFSKNLDLSEARLNYIKALNKGLLKVLSKMGISTLRSYNGAQVFEAIGLDQELITRYFKGTSSVLSGFKLEQIAASTWKRHHDAWTNDQGDTFARLPSGGQIHYRKSGERHAWQPETIAYLQHASKQKNMESYAKFRDLANGSPQTPQYIRHLLTFKTVEVPLPSSQKIEEASEIVKKFTTGAMSLGAISREAHETLALAMNQVGGKSNTGEGGEDPSRQIKLPNGRSKLSAIRQVASARFGVTLDYLSQGQELQIKIAQGAKPGEGGQLPGHKVDAEIARLRHSTPGVALISPPPHHDIYSIEDLAQLIHDLKEANPKAIISVKLVAATGIGAVAAGVAKAGAHKIVVSCGSGGTGASPLSSIKHAGLPWEIGLAETHQTLVINGLRPWVKLEVDGQLKTGRDVVIAAMLGADEFGFATAPLIVTGCIMMRKCHLNTCPVGIATQDPELRSKFQGNPEHVINYMFMVAEDTRDILQKLGLNSLSEARGRSDLLEENSVYTKPRGLDLRPLLHCPKPPTTPNLLPKHPISQEDSPTVPQDGHISTAQRSFGTRLAYERLIQEKSGLSLAPLSLSLKGYAGQSFGAFLTRGVTLHLHGVANDYVGKGLSGGSIIIVPSKPANWDESPPAAIGNTVLYGATSGHIFVAGSAGERFAVRNSGATAVVEGTGHHCCEYMTGGLVIVLGKTGRNFAAGMSGGYAYVWDDDGTFTTQVNHDMVDIDLLVHCRDAEETQRVQHLIAKHAQLTGSVRAQYILDSWPMALTKIKKVTPKEYKTAILPGLQEKEKPLSASKHALRGSLGPQVFPSDSPFT